MGDLTSEFGDFQATNQSAYVVNQPTGSTYSDRFNWFKSDIKIANPQKNEQQQYRIVPWPNQGYFAVEVRLHQGLGSEKNSCPCPCMLGPDQKCPLCKASRQAYNSGNQEMGRAFGGKARYLMWIIDRKHPELGPQLWQIPQQTLESIRSQMVDPRTGAVMAIDHLDAGYDVFFKKRPETPASPFNTINDIILDKQPSALGSKEDAGPWIAYIRSHSNLADILNFPEPNVMEALAGIDAFDPEGGDGFPSDTEAPMATPPQVDQAALQQALQQQTAAPEAAVPPTPTPVNPAPAPVAPPAPAVSSAPAPVNAAKVDMDSIRAKLAAKKQGS